MAVEDSTVGAVTAEAIGSHFSNETHFGGSLHFSE
jgi:hypothetical protein